MTVLSDLLLAPVTSLDEGKAWIAELTRLDLMFHFEDSPDTIIRGATGAPLFTDPEAAIVAARVAELYELDWGMHECPIGYALDISEPGWRDAPLSVVTP